jgi:hypothetical protein
MACKRSAVRARLAPLVTSEIRTDRTASTAAEYSNGGRVGRRMCVRSDMFPRLGLLAGHRIPGAEPTLVSLSPGQIPPHRSGDSCWLATARPSQGAIPASGCCRICKWSGRAGRPGRAIHSREPRQLARRACSRTAGAARGLSAWRRWCQPRAGLAGALRHSGAELRRGAALCARAGALVRHVSNQARRGAQGLGRAPADIGSEGTTPESPGKVDLILQVSEISHPAMLVGQLPKLAPTANDGPRHLRALRRAGTTRSSSYRVPLPRLCQ